MAMSPFDWQRIEAIYHAALARPLPERAAFLADACAGDDAIRREVESLLAAGDPPTLSAACGRQLRRGPAGAQARIWL